MLDRQLDQRDAGRPADGALQPAVAGEPVIALRRPSRAWRLVVLAVLAAAYLTGTLVGQDAWWPFGPWRMFATSTAPTGDVTVLALQVATHDRPAWTDSGLTPTNIGLNRAEVEGRQLQLAADPMLVQTLATAHARMHPGDAAWTGVRLVRRATVLVDGRPTGQVRQSVLVEWTLSGGARPGQR